LAPSASFLKFELVTKGSVRFCGSSTMVVTTNQVSVVAFGWTGRRIPSLPRLRFGVGPFCGGSRAASLSSTTSRERPAGASRVAPRPACGEPDHTHGRLPLGAARPTLPGRLRVCRSQVGRGWIRDGTEVGARASAGPSLVSIFNVSYVLPGDVQAAGHAQGRLRHRTLCTGCRRFHRRRDSRRCLRVDQRAVSGSPAKSPIDGVTMRPAPIFANHGHPVACRSTGAL